jgi:hypothetical protein
MNMDIDIDMCMATKKYVNLNPKIYFGLSTMDQIFTDSRSVGKLLTEPVNEEIHQNYRFKTQIIGLSEFG